jgi:hypothetical protein
MCRTAAMMANYCNTTQVWPAWVFSKALFTLQRSYQRKPEAVHTLKQIFLVFPGELSFRLPITCDLTI